MTQLKIISPLKIFSVFVNRNMKLYVIVLNVIMDVAVQETIDINNLLNKTKLEIINLPTTRHSLQNFGTSQ